MARSGAASPTSGDSGASGTAAGAAPRPIPAGTDRVKLSEAETEEKLAKGEALSWGELIGFTKVSATKPKTGGQCSDDGDGSDDDGEDSSNNATGANKEKTKEKRWAEEREGLGCCCCCCTPPLLFLLSFLPSSSIR